jgi:P4 family phage/plasmid primase-like protien
MLSKEERQEKIKLINEKRKIADTLKRNMSWLSLITDLINEVPIIYDKNKLYWIWNETEYKWEYTDETELLNIIQETAEINNITSSKIKNEIIESIKLAGRRKSKNLYEFNKKWIQFKNKIINYETKEEIEVTPEYFNTNVIPHNIKNGETPIIDRLFKEWVGEEYSQTLKEIIAYSMTQDYPLHKLFCLTGTGLNGKGVFQNLLRKVIGEDNISSTELDLLMENRFESVKLYRKLVCQIGETNFSEISKTSMLKKLSGQDLVGIEYKQKQPFDFVNYAKIIINTNSLPPTTDKTIGFYRRWLIIDFPNRFKEGRDVLKYITEEEIENLCGQCIKLIPEIIERGNFHNEGDIEERRKRYEEKSNPIKQFIEENYEKDINSESPFFIFYDKFSLYLQERGLRGLSKKTVSSLLNNEGFETEKLHKNQNVWVYIMGLKIKKNTDVTDVTLFQLNSPIEKLSSNQQKSVTSVSEENFTNLVLVTIKQEKRILWNDLFLCFEAKIGYEKFNEIIDYLLKTGQIMELKGYISILN